MTTISLRTAAKRIASPDFALRLIELRAECEAAGEGGLPIDRAVRVLGLPPAILAVIAAYQTAASRAARLSQTVHVLEAGHGRR